MLSLSTVDWLSLYSVLYSIMQPLINFLEHSKDNRLSSNPSPCSSSLLLPYRAALLVAVRQSWSYKNRTLEDGLVFAGGSNCHSEAGSCEMKRWSKLLMSRHTITSREIISTTHRRECVDSRGWIKPTQASTLTPLWVNSTCWKVIHNSGTSCKCFSHFCFNEEQQGSDDGLWHSESLAFWTLSIVRNSK
jgi:hypothetical protein